MNKDDLSTGELDLHSLHLVRQVARFRSFTLAAESCGLSQSALTRQVQSVERRIGIKIFDRTTRSVAITEAGAVLLRETEAIPNILSGAMRRIREEYLGERRKIRIGISRDLSLAHIPGIFHQQSKLHPEIMTMVSQPDEQLLLKQTSSAMLDLAIMTLPLDLPGTVDITHRMQDHFSMVVPASVTPPSGNISKAGHKRWLESQTWLLPPAATSVRSLVERSLSPLKAMLNPAMELENFDLMLQFVSMGMGCAFVPRRTLSGFPRKNRIRTIAPPVEIKRTLVAIVPASTSVPAHVETFIRGILFS